MLSMVGRRWASGRPKFSITPSTVVRMTSKVGGQEGSHQRRQFVVVAELHFGERHGVVLS
jgi:hypothetical protein